MRRTGVALAPAMTREFSTTPFTREHRISPVDTLRRRSPARPPTRVVLQTAWLTTMSATRNPQQQHREPLSTDTATGRATRPRQQFDTVIVHSDGSYHDEENLSAAGFTIETNGGDVVTERWLEAPDAETSMETEAAAALAAIREAKQFGPSHIVLYSDCKPLVDRLQDEHPPKNLKDVYRKVRAELERVEFANIVHIPRERNRRADELAHRALRELRAEEHGPII